LGIGSCEIQNQNVSRWHLSHPCVFGFGFLISSSTSRFVRLRLLAMSAGCSWSSLVAHLFGFVILQKLFREIFASVLAKSFCKPSLFGYVGWLAM